MNKTDVAILVITGFLLAVFVVWAQTTVFP